MGVSNIAKGGMVDYRSVALYKRWVGYILGKREG